MSQADNTMDDVIADIEANPNVAHAYMKLALEDYEEGDDTQALSAAIHTVIQAAEAGVIPMEKGSGNVFADLGLPDAEAKKRKAALSYEITKVLDAQGWSHQKAASLLGVPETELERITSADSLDCTETYLEDMLKRLSALED